MIKAGVIGATGYAGSEILRILSGHPHVRVTAITSRSHAGEEYGEIFENFRHEAGLICDVDDIESVSQASDVIFVALPHGAAGERINERVLARTKVIDLGADFRLKSAETYEEWYGVKNTWRGLLKEAVYGLCEINREAIATARLVANPGCYTTCGILALYPLLKEGVVDPDSVIIDAKSGVSGAGRGVDLNTLFCEVNESIKPYKVASHRHTPEIEETLSLAAARPVKVSFTPHLAPMSRGILATCYADLKKDCDCGIIMELYRRYYAGEFFIRLCRDGKFPETRWVKGSNFCDIGLAVDKRCGRVIVAGALDNLVKGAAGQAVQNMNIMFGFNETAGLTGIPAFPG
ncbi:MAG: N-acetyl-gamma-glutamyl-phosphate reductase [Clostridiales bacterium]|jgi:N-acetyl-gamma-glutamyl-phosphate reductase|nr:N-acetyl-gamma-glutamyl-phosphate reductase [Clostridiales bacterium]